MGQWALAGQGVAREAGRQNNDFSSAVGQQVGHRVLRAEVALRFSGWREVDLPYTESSPILMNTPVKACEG